MGLGDPHLSDCLSFPGPNELLAGQKGPSVRVCVGGGVVCVRGVTNPKKSGLGEHGNPQDREE